ncbi:MAG TPA: DMT family transporter [Chitinophagales bacterium]|nr:DMT family transporter [Chitinophagales bacterium]
MDSRTKQAHVYMHLSILLWGITGVLGSSISLREGVLVWWRLLLVSISLGLQILLLKRSFKVTKTQFYKMTAVGVLLMVHWLFFYGAIKYSNVSITLSCFSTTSLFTALIEPIFGYKKLRVSEILFSLLGIVGIVFIFYDGSDYILGIALALMAAFVGSFFNIFNKEIVLELPPDIVSFYEMLTGFVGLTILLPIYLHFFPDSVLLPSTNDWALLAILAFVCTHVALTLSLAALKYLSAFTLNLAVNLEPIYGIALAFILLGENELLGINFYIGSCIVLLSVVAHAWYVSKYEALA